MKIGIYERDHFEGAYPVIKLFDTEDNQITIFTNRKSFRQFAFLFGEHLKRYQWIIQEENESLYRFLLRIRRFLRKEKLDLLYLNTVSDNFIFYDLMIRNLTGTRISLTLHDINNFFLPSSQSGLRPWVRAVGKQALRKSIREYNVVSQTMVEYLASLTTKDTRIHCLPGAVFEPENYQPSYFSLNETLNIAVPGTIDTRRRNYQEVFALLDILHQKNLKVRLTLLGGFSPDYQEDILEKCKIYQSLYHNLVYFDTELVDQPLFDQALNESHLLFIPNTVNTVMSDGIKEVYGKSKSSGNLFDVIKHARPFIAPAGLDIERSLKDSVFQYESVPEIADFLEDLTRFPEKFAFLLSAAYKASTHYLPEKIRERNPSLFQSARLET